jgi:type VI secretion system protein ImpB
MTFESLDDFSPEAVAKRVGPLKELLDLRTKLADLRGSLQGNDKLEELLMDAVNSTEKLEKLKGEVKGADSNE